MELSVSRSLSFGERRGVMRNLDLVSAGSVVALAMLGLLAVYRATGIDPEQGGLLRAPSELFNKQLAFCFIGAIVLIATVLFDYRYFKIYAVIAYLANLFLLLAVLTPIGHDAKGAQRWISVGILKLQPSELAKPVLLCMLAAYLSERRRPLEIADVMRTIGLAAPMAFLVFIQPDLGTVIVLGAIVIVCLLVAGADPRHLLLLLSTAAFVVFMAFQLGLLRGYQLTRFAAFLEPDQYRYGEGWNYLKMPQAIANGYLTGIGIFSERSFTALKFVHSQYTDLVFTVIAELMGFVGGVTLLGLYAVVFVRGMRSGAMARDAFGTILACGAAGYLAFQVFLNVGMTLGLAPITGIPLPFVSYGGSSLVSSAIAVGVMLNVRMRRFARPS